MHSQKAPRRRTAHPCRAHVKQKAASGKHPARKKTHVSIPLLAADRRHVAAEHAIGESKSGDPIDIDLPQTGIGGQNAVVGNADSLT